MPEDRLFRQVCRRPYQYFTKKRKSAALDDCVSFLWGFLSVDCGLFVKEDPYSIHKDMTYQQPAQHCSAMPLSKRMTIVCSSFDTSIKKWRIRKYFHETCHIKYFHKHSTHICIIHVQPGAVKLVLCGHWMACTWVTVDSISYVLFFEVGRVGLGTT